MTRTITHLLLILVVLACPVQCVIGGELCCASETSAAEAVAESPCSSAGNCCHHSRNEPGDPTSDSEAPAPVPQSDDDCHCDCLCNGAIASASQVAEDCIAAMLHTGVVWTAEYSAAATGSAVPPADPPDTLSGREIRTLRMSFQV